MRQYANIKHIKIFGTTLFSYKNISKNEITFNDGSI